MGIMGLQIFVLITLALKFSFAADSEATVFDKYTGEPVTEEQFNIFEDAGITNTCTMNIKACSESERRRVDGSCNSLNNPSKGTFLVPQTRILPATYYNVSKERLSSSGEELTLARIVRTILLWEGKSISQNFTQSMPGFGIWTFGDTGSDHDIRFFILNVTNCCEPEHMNDAMCTPNIYPEDDPVHRFSGIRCSNLTKPLDHQFMGCTNDSTPAPIALSTAVMDLSQIYNAANGGEEAIRSYEGGKLATETDEYGVVWPPSGTSTGCLANKGPDETRCYSNYPTGLLSGVLIALWLLRNHNYYATELAKVNPCWDDDQLFYTAREMNIALYLQIVYYEWLPAISGTKYLYEKEIISSETGFRDLYDESKYPLVTLEYLYILRYFHTAQEATANKYYSNGTYMDSFPSTQLMFRPGKIAQNKDVVYYMQGMFRQECAEIDHGTDPEMSEIGMPLHIQRSVDIPTSDLHKARTLGLAPYIDYVNYCTGDNITSWDDLNRHMSSERIGLLKRVYDTPKDIDLMAGAWSENNIDGGSIPATVACLIVDYLKKAIISDRHWYEREGRPYAFTSSQLQEIRKSSLALLICKNGDEVTEVQQKAFLTVSSENPLVDCSEIPSFDFSAWEDTSCSSR